MVFLEKLFGKWVEFKYFDMIEAEDQFEKYKKDLKLGELLIIEDETIKKTYVKDGRYVASIKYTDKEVGVLKRTQHGTPCIHFVYMNGDEEYILCYDVFKVNLKTGDKNYKHGIGRRVLTPEEITYLKEKGKQIKTEGGL